MTSNSHVGRRSRHFLVALLWSAYIPIALANGVLSGDVTPANITQTICAPGYTKKVRPPSVYTNKIKKRLMSEAGIELPRIHEFELDHIIPLALGGHPRKLENLQLQPWDGDHGAHRKDRIEVKLQCLVCSDQVQLEQAQKEIGDDWQAAYHRYAKLKCLRKKGAKSYFGE